MSNKCYAEEFKIEAAKPIAERPYPVAEVSARSQTGRFSFFYKNECSRDGESRTSVAENKFLYS
jgi:hypothetical protein